MRDIWVVAIATDGSPGNQQALDEVARRGPSLATRELVLAFFMTSSDTAWLTHPKPQMAHAWRAQVILLKWHLV